jgi:predicted RecA/RadA family phage recombinase
LTIAAGETVTIATTGVFDLPKPASAVIAAGDKVSWDDSAKQANVPGPGRYPIDTAIEAAGNAVTTARVRLNGVATEAA